MKKFSFFLFAIVAIVKCERSLGQTLYVPNGTIGITSSSNTSVGIGTSTPQAKLHITVENQDNVGLIIQGNTVNQDLQPHYVGLAFDGDYGNGTGNKSQIRSYSNLYSYYGSSLTFHTTAASSGDNLFERMRINPNGYVGIGTSEPLNTLHVKGSFYLDGTDWNGPVACNYLYYRGHNLIVGSKPGTFMHNILQLRPGGAAEGLLWSTFQMFDALGVDNYNLRIQLSSHGESFLNGGNVLIGKTSQSNSSYKLDVAGKIRADEITVNTTGADFVFHPSYKLRSLSEIETYIQAHQHLPDIASASQMQEDGVSVSEMQTKLLQKIEELTLYTIDQDKKLAEQRQINADLQKKILEQELQTKEIKEILAELLNNQKNSNEK